MDVADNLLFLKLTIKFKEILFSQKSEFELINLRLTNLVHKPQITKEKNLFQSEHLQIRKLRYNITLRVCRYY